MFKKSFFLLGLYFCFIFSFTSHASAQNAVSYPKPINVEIDQKSNVSIQLNGLYELQNLATNEKKLIYPGAWLQANKNGSSVIVALGDKKYTSNNKGFKITEMSRSPILVSFTSTTDLHSGALSSYPVKETLVKAEAAYYIGEFINNRGEKWFNVTTANGKTGWVPASTSFTLNAPNLSLTKVNGISYRGSLSLTTADNGVKVINTLDIEDYLKGVVPNEMPASWHKEALKAQAIVARSYAANSSYLKDTTASQVYKGYSSEDSRTSEAIEETAGIVVKYNSKPIQTFFFSTSGGRTANVWDVWNSSQSTYPYLKSVEDPYEDSPHSNWQYEFRSRSLLKSFGFSAQTVLYDVSIQKTGQNGEVTGVTLKTSSGNKTITGNESQIRDLFPIANYGKLKSNWFDLTATKEYTVQTNSGNITQFGVYGQVVQTTDGIQPIYDSQIKIQMNNQVITKESDPKSIVLDGKGWGHRIGMSQYGAKGFAENGWKAIDIVQHYFPGTAVSR